MGSQRRSIRSRARGVRAGRYDVDESVGLVARLDELRNHPRENRDVVVRALDPAPGVDGELWDAVVELQVAGRDEGHDEAEYRTFTRALPRDPV